MESDTVRLYRAQCKELAELEAKAHPDDLDETRKAVLRACIRGSEIMLINEERRR
jgi:hypothetical protein